MRILGVDPGLRFCGYGLIEAGKSGLKLIEAGIVSTSASQKIENRLNKIHSSFDELILEAKPEALILEKLYAHYRHPATAFLLGHARGVICLLCAKYRIGLYEYLPTRVKKALVGNGHAGKGQIQSMIKKIFGIKEEGLSFDLSDALALAVAYAYIEKIK